MKEKCLVLLLGIVFWSCNNDDTNYEPLSELDRALEIALFRASDNIGSHYYKLPDSDDFLNIPQDINNPLSTEKVYLGKMLFHETALAVNASHSDGMGTYSCASCHHSDADFQSGKRQGIGDGGFGFGMLGEARVLHQSYSNANVDVQPIKSPTVLNTAYQKIMLWNGQFGATGMNEGTESQWTVGTPKESNSLGFEGLETQAIAGLTVHRMGMDEGLVNSLNYKEYFDSAFSQDPVEERYTIKNTGLAIAAYERTLLANKAPFQEWLNGNLNAMSDDEKKGAMLFFDKAKCYQCHNGPSLASMKFSAIGMNDLFGGDMLGNPVDDITRKGRGGFTQNPMDDYKFKVPQLYNIKTSGAYGHGASFNSIKEVIKYKNLAVKQNGIISNNILDPDFVPLGLTEEEIEQLTLFIENSLQDNYLERYVPESVMSGNCFPNNDSESQQDLGCN
jgi:cytochrome c peroxidase